MAAHYFLDTNVLVYAFEPADPIKQARARELIDPSISWKISWQVVQEFIHVARHRFRKPLDSAYLGDLIDLLLASHCSVSPGADLWKKALTVQSETQYHFYDSLIVAAAIEAGAPILYSEDLQHERHIGPLQIINPFL